MKNSEFFKIDDESKKSVKIFFWIFGIFIIGIFFYLKKTKNNTTKKQILNYEMNVKVVDVYNDRNEHNFTFVKFSNGKRVLREYPYEIGDSISKIKNDSIEYIYRNGTIIKYNTLEYYRKIYKMKL